MTKRITTPGSAAFHILLVLAEGPAHGYAIGRQIASDSLGIIKPGAAVLYTLLARLSTENIIEEIPNYDEKTRRKYYRITQKGHLELKELAAYIAHTEQILKQRHVIE